MRSARFESVQKSHAFTLLELLVAMSVLAVLMVLLLSMVDGATKLWRNSENRVDSYREARAALNLIANDLASLYASTNQMFFQLDPSNITPAEANTLHASGSANSLFFVSALSAEAQDNTKNKSDLCALGYFMDYARTAPKELHESYNLYRFIASSDPTFIKLQQGKPPFTNVSADTEPDTSGQGSELLARNIAKFTIQATMIPLDTDGKSKPPEKFQQSAQNPIPDYLDISLTAFNEETANHFGSQKADWHQETNPTYQANARTFTTRVYLPAAAVVKTSPSPTPTPTP